MKYKKIMKLMAEEISKLRIETDLEWGAYYGENADCYKVNKIIEEFIEECEKK